MTAAFTHDAVQTIAAELADRAPGTLIGSVASRYGVISISEAYHLQKVLSDHATGRPRGYKIALGSPTAQATYGLDAPITGRLLDHQCLCDGSTLDLAEHFQPKLEVEIAVQLTSALTGGEALSSADVSANAHHLFPAFEVADRRITAAPGPERGLDLIIDNAGFGAAVFGTQPLPVRAPDLTDLRVILYRDGREIVSGEVDPGFHGPMATTARVLTELNRSGQAPRPGDYILSGMIFPAVNLEPGTYLAEFHAGAALPPATVSLAVELGARSSSVQ